MSLDRDELAARNMAALLGRDGHVGDAEAQRLAADVAVGCADALIARLAPAPWVGEPGKRMFADAAPRPEWVRILSLPNATMGGVGYFVDVGSAYPVVGWNDLGSPDVMGRAGMRVALSAAGASIDPKHPAYATWEPCAAPATAPDHPTAASFAARRGQGAAGDQRVAAGLDAPAKPAPAVDREAFTTLLDAVKWVLNDAAFKAPEQMGEVAERWVARLERAIDSLPPSLTKGGAS